MFKYENSTLLKGALSGLGIIVLALSVGLGRNDPKMIVLHHTVSPTAQSAISGLMNRGLSYHYLIEKNGAIIQMVNPHRIAEHASGYNRDTIGISYVGGGKFGPANEIQIQASVKLIKALKKEFPKLVEITGHKHIARNGKSDPMWACDKPEKNDWKCDAIYMNKIAKDTDLKFLTRKEIYGRY